ncbi:PEP-CTERM sorting domain-containing protein [Roseateles sp. BYS180W]|uniref:PEP-CTERM sorting domain-containing protein n=1 Tax=Roseateles rivi TaxID=3299028 RepID=A0ABW7FSL1_9BURK
MHQTLTLRSAIAGALLLVAASAQAALTAYNTPASFAAATTASGTDTFSDLIDNGSVGVMLDRNAGSYSYRVSAPSGLWASGPADNPFMSSSNTNDAITVAPLGSMANGIAGNFFFSDIAGNFAAGPLAVTVQDSTGASLTLTVNPSGYSSGSFMGFVSSGYITSLSVSAPAGQPNTTAWSSLDNLTLAAAAPVPEPGTWALMGLGLGLAGLGLVRRRRTQG